MRKKKRERTGEGKQKEGQRKKWERRIEEKRGT